MVCDSGPFQPESPVAPSPKAAQQPCLCFMKTETPEEGKTVSMTAEEVFHAYAPRVYNLARRLLGNEADAEDVTQDVLLQVVRKLGGFRGESGLFTWLHRVTVNAALALRRRHSRRADLCPAAPLDGWAEERAGPSPDAADQQALEQEAAALLE